MTQGWLLPCFVGTAAAFGVLQGCSGGEPALERDAGARGGEPHSALAGVSDPTAKPPEPEFEKVDVGRLRAMHQHMPGWEVYASAHFAVVHNVDEATAIALARAAESLTIALYRAAPRTGPLDTPLIRCVRDADLYYAYGGSGNTLGTYEYLRNEIVVRKFSDGERSTVTVLNELIRGWWKENSPAERRKKIKFVEEWAARTRRRGR